MSKNYNKEIGYETLQDDFKVYQKQTPKGITLVKSGKKIKLQFKTASKPRSKYDCNCTYTLDGMIDAVKKARKVAEKLKSIGSESDFWDWYKAEIEEVTDLESDLITFEDAIAKVESDFWDRPDRRKQERKKSDPNAIASWNRTYGVFFKHLPLEKIINTSDILTVINRQKKGTRNYRYAVSAMKKLARINHKINILNKLDELNTIQTKFANLQNADLDNFLDWRLVTLGVTASLPECSDVNMREAWLWAFSMQVVYGLRINEVFAIQNLDKPYTAKDDETIPALSDQKNQKNIIYIGEKTILGTTVKTGSRYARPLTPPTHPDLIEALNIKTPLIPQNKPKSNKPETIKNFYCKTAREKLSAWGAPFTQTHALRNLANVNGLIAGIPQEIRAQSLGHTPAVNDSNYKRRQSTKTTLNLLLNSNTNAIDFVSALNAAKELVKEYSESKSVVALLIAKIYQKDSSEIIKLL